MGNIYKIENPDIKNRIVNALNNLKFKKVGTASETVGWSIIVDVMVDNKLYTYMLFENQIIYNGYLYSNMDTHIEYDEFYDYILSFV